ncbi:MAG: FAD-dependent oxidoreductase, partial [Candidatus Limnocylindrales bacterium]
MTTWDVCVYGGTAGGVVAAVTAARSGAEVVLLEPGQHLGGMVSGGLGNTDMERQEHFIGGHARRFFEDVGARYGQSLAWRFEPHVAEEIFIDWVERAGVEVRLGSMIEDVEMVDTRIGSLRLKDRSIIKAAAYVDASYEGDLLAAAGASFAIGRESRSLNRESLAGRRELLPDPHQFRAPVLASRAGGLTRYLQPLDGICLPGEGDNKIQSYCYRICLTADRANGEPIPPPTGYDAEQYQLLAAYLEALGERATIRDVLGIGELPNGKTDINSGGPISTNLLGASW